MTWRHSLIALVIVVVLTLAGCSVAGCGGVGHAVGGVGAHKILNHVAPSHKRTINKAFCLYHGHRLLVDLKHHHLIGAGINGYAAYKACKAGFGHNNK